MARKPENMQRTLKLLSRYLARHKFTLLAVALLVILSSAANIAGTYLFKPLINEYIIPRDFRGLVWALLAMAVMYFTGVAATWGYNRLMAKAAQQIIFEIRSDLFCHVQTLPLKFFDSRTHGELMSNFTNDIDTLADALNNSFTLLIQSFTMLSGTLVMLFLLNWRLSLIVALFLSLMFLFIQYNSGKSRRYFRKQQEYMASVNSFVEEMVTGQKVEKVFNHEEKDFTEFCRRNEELRAAGTTALTYSAMTMPAVVALSYINYAVSACAGGLFALGGLMDLGGLASYLVYVRQSAMPMNQFTMTLNFLLSALSGAERIFALMQEKPEPDEGTVTLRHDGAGNYYWLYPDTGRQVPLAGDVRFRDVSFGYVPGKTVLSHISLFARPGEKIAFVGSTGAGKTTIINLMNRFYEIQDGSITYDGIDLRDIKKEDLRRSMAFVIQDTHLFTGTILENIRYGNPSASDEEVIAAAKLANAHFFIRKLPDGYRTMLYGDGANLSQGQRQLLAIARAAVAKPPVLVLDEATSSVDTRTEKLIENGMDALMEGRTVFVIAHRLSTVRNAGAILVLENGAVIERGSHEDLIAQKGRYYKLYTGQFELE
ncbi:MAG: multidrug ABC transporter ATP-binding protein [Clostridiales bacterium]|nr:MAG: multidrug ABC transporter ATP-binding protein [Clostridiales bacterium]